MADAAACGADRVEQSAILAQGRHWNFAKAPEHLKRECEAGAALAEMTRPGLISRQPMAQVGGGIFVAMDRGQPAAQLYRQGPSFDRREFGSARDGVIPRVQIVQRAR